jgi:hypothetical protein
MIFLCATLLIITLGVMKFIKDSREQYKTTDKWLEVPYMLRVFNGKSGGEEDEYDDPILARLTREGKPKEEEGSVYKSFSMRTTINLADVVQFSEWTLNKFEDEKVFGNCTQIEFNDGTTLLVLVLYDDFKATFEEYQNELL